MNNEDMVYVLSNTNFMKWIIKELNEHYYIDDHNSKLDEEDTFYATKLKVLYELVEEFATNHNIVATRSNQYNLYYVYYNGTVFFVYEGANSYGCFNNTLDKKNVLYCINFDDVVKSKIDDIINSDTGLLYGLKKEIIKLNNCGVSLEFIEKIFGKVLEEVKEEKGKSYVKKREDL